MSSSSSPPAKRYRYQQIKSVEHLYLAKKCADVYFTFETTTGVNTRIPAHRNLLGAESDEFEKAFYGEPKQNGDIRVADVSEAAFKEFLQFFYLSDFKLSAEHIADVILLGDKYQVKACIDACEKFLKNDLADENVCTALWLGLLCDRMEMVKICETHIILNTVAVLASDGFLKCNKSVLDHILNMKILSCSEVDVFRACMSWTRVKSRQTELTKSIVEFHLGQSFYNIRFASMTIQEFCHLSIEYNSVLSGDYETITKIIVVPDFKPDEFNTNPRIAEWKLDAIITCERRVKCGPNQKLNLRIQEMTTFSTNEPLMLGSFGCANKIHVITGINPSSHHDLRSDLLLEAEFIEARDLNGDEAKVLLKMNARFGMDDGMVSLTHPILIRPGFFYTIRIGPFPKQHLVCSKMLKSKVRMQPAIVVEFHKNVPNADVEELISTLHFNRI